jgi:hypothetical protein
MESEAAFDAIGGEVRDVLTCGSGLGDEGLEGGKAGAGSES